MKSVDVIQKVKVLPRATASHQPGSETRWREETNVRSRVEQVSRVCMEPRKWFESRGPERDNHPGMLDSRVWEARTVSCRWNAVSASSLWARPGGGHRGRRPDHADTGIARELVRASSASCLCRRGTKRQTPWESTAIPKLPPRKGPLLRRVDPSVKRGDDGYQGTSVHREGTWDGR